MNEFELLKEYLEVLVEAIRTKKGVKGKFKVEQFKKLSSYQEMLRYAEHFLEELGEGKQAGSSRRAFIFSGSKVLKVAKNDAGVAQNETETLISKTSPESEVFHVVTKVHAHDPEFRWILVDMAKIEGADQVTADKFKSYAGVSWQMFHSIVGGDVDAKEVKLSARGRTFVDSVLKLIEKSGLERGDVMKLNHWGVIGNGNMVLIDFGFTFDVKMKEYEPVEKDGKRGWAPKDKERERQREEERKAMEFLNAPKKRDMSASPGHPGEAAT